MPGTSIPLLTGPQDPALLDYIANQIINGINGYVTGVTPEVVQVTAGSTTGNIPTFGQVTLNSTTRTSGTTGRYTLAKPTAAQVGQQLILTCISTVKATVSGNFEKAKTKLSFTSTAAAASVKLPSAILTAVSTSLWAVVGGFGNVTTT